MNSAKVPFFVTIRYLSIQGFSIKSMMKLIAAGAVMAVTSGCSSFLSIGSPDFSCNGLPEGAQCMSARETYEATNDGHVPLPLKAEDQEVKGGKKSSKKAAKKAAKEEVEEVETVKAKPADTVIDNYVAPRLPDRPIPIRTPAQVMRIWVAPWEDDNGDLITNGYVYTEIEPRRWVIGQPGAAAPTVLRPLQTINSNKKRPTQSEKVN
ncbi:type IV conjugative transfer system lipoprotein TraV [Thiopseudomonas alkaliphila]|uniref:type IV conjugative transfer system lipoprotein TraV n=1 Tax=Thiopseudomonas alkaliphila TaxID=1697053 RepID=UPI00257730DD|nr:type IV conjugative transfer system lipoprotein TraV [Thiopseudomonas alkaliphila]MDM1717352.1 type IV conjugative transfer system lipoprotein TraV [Thiopseudomonas alkaliphila]